MSHDDMVRVFGDVRVLSSMTLADTEPVGRFFYLSSTGGFATCHNGGGVKLWNTVGSLEATLEGHTKGVNDVVERGCGVVTASEDHTARVWEGSTCVAVLEGHTLWVSSAAVHPKTDNTVFTAAWDSTIREWDVAAASCTRVLVGHQRGVTVLQFFPDGSLLSGSADHTVRVWGPDGTCTSVDTQTCGVFSVAVLSDGSYLVGGGQHQEPGFVGKWADGSLQWAADTGHPIDWLSPFAFWSSSPGHCFLFFGASGKRAGEAVFAKKALPGGCAGRDTLCVLTRPNSVWFIKSLRGERFQAIRVLSAAWAAHGGNPPPAVGGGLGAVLARVLCLRRLCRVRGVDKEAMPWEVVEPFGREVVAFL